MTDIYATVAHIRRTVDDIAGLADLDVVWALADARGLRIQELEREVAALRARLRERGAG